MEIARLSGGQIYQPVLILEDVIFRLLYPASISNLIYGKANYHKIS
jgi:hypothetical protein